MKYRIQIGLAGADHEYQSHISECFDRSLPTKTSTGRKCHALILETKACETVLFKARVHTLAKYFKDVTCVSCRAPYPAGMLTF
jgi:hypothetical protein